MVFYWLNKNLNNLEWCTRSQNLIHAYKTGLEKKQCGEKHHAHKLTWEKVDWIRKHCIKGDRQYGTMALGRMFNVDKSTIQAIVDNEIWKEEYR